MSNSAMLTSVRRLRCLLAGQQGPEQSDEQLLSAFADRREESAFAALVHRHGPMVLGVCRRVLGHVQDAEDAYQATFLVLARRAAALRNKTALASFLHGTAYHLASKIKRAAGRRRKHEGHASARSPSNPADELLWREVRALLDEEIAQLPEKYRSIFVLCCLENVSQAEAGQRLGMKERTVSHRLAQARQRLARRLARRGVELTALLAATTLVSTLPSGLMAKTVDIALATSVIPASIAELVRGATAPMMMSKAKAALLAVTLLSGVGLCLLASPQRERGQPLLALRAGEEKRETANKVEIHGRVLGPDGKPKAGAKLLLLGENDKITELGVTDADGRFAVTVPKRAKGRLIARTEGAGIDFLSIANLKPEKPIELRLVKDRPIRGRIVTTEGKPVSGARVAVRLIRVYANNSLDSFATAWAKRRGNSETPEGVKDFWPGGSALFTTTTDADGRFILRGIGAERLVFLNIVGPGIASTERRVVNRDGFDATPYNQELLNHSPGKVQWGPWIMLSGPDVSIVAEREKIIRGIVKDADTGKGVAGARVGLVAGDEGNDIFRGLLALPLDTRTDAEGRYEIRGALKARSYLLQVRRDRDRGYLGCAVRVTEDTHGYQPFTANLSVKKGVIVTGKIIDKSTGKPVPGLVETAVLNGNPFAKDYPSDSGGFISHAETGKDGTFRELVIPGPVLLKGGVNWTRLPGGEAEEMGYKKWVPDPKYPKYFQTRPEGDPGYIGLGGDLYAYGGNACKVVNAKPGTAIIHQDLFVERESAKTVRIQDAEGRPLGRAWAAGLRADNNWPIRLNGNTCLAYALEADKPRLMVFYEPSKKLAGLLRLTANEKEPIVAKLEPVGSIRGRLLGGDGKPLAGVVVDARYRDGEAGHIHEILHKAKHAITDADGSFALDDLLPDLKFELTFRQGKRGFERELKPDEAAIQVRPGPCHDVGTIKLKPVPKKVDE